MTTNLIKIATSDDENIIIQSIVLSFIADPIARWLYPSFKEYLFNYPSLVKLFLSKSLISNCTYYINEFTGTSIWLAPDIKLDEEAISHHFEKTVPQNRITKLLEIFENMVKYHPSEPHWYLSLIGIDIYYQNRGYGSALLEKTLQICDKENKIAYLEATNEKNLSLYKRHGFEVHGKIEVEGSLFLYPMIRLPQ